MKQTKLLGGDVKSTHLVKGLDFALLQRVRRGENVMDEDSGEGAGDDAVEVADEEDVDEKLEKALEKEVVAVEKTREKKHGELAPKPKTRAEILAELKRSRQLAREAAQPSLGSKFRKIGEPREKVQDGLRVKHVVGADGKVKRKVKRSDRERQQAQLDVSPPRGVRVMGMMPPPPLPGAKAQREHEQEEADGDDDDDDDIFAGAGDYDPLAALGGDDDDDDEEDSDSEPPKRLKKQEEAEALRPHAQPERPEPEPGPERKGSMSPPPKPTVNYFNESPADSGSEGYKPPSSASDLLASNPELAAALQKASKLAAIPTKEEAEREKRRKALVEAHERDSYDIDMGFGGSTTFGDDDDDEGIDSKGGGAKKRKRGGGKKKKGDKNSADVVGKIVEQKYGSGRS